MFALKKTAGVGLGALALSMAGLTGHVWASTLTYTGTPTYATQAVAGASPPGTVTIPSAGAAGIVYTTTAATAATTTTGNFTVVFTLPTGVTPSGTVTAAVGNAIGATCTANPTLAGTVSSNTITFIVPTLAGGAAGDQCSVTLNSFTVSGATFLQTPTTSTATAGFLVTAQLTATTGNAFVLDPMALKAALASSKNGLTVTPTTGAATNVDTLVGAGGASLNGQAAPGKVFISAGTDQLLDSLGTVMITSTAGTVAANGTTAFSFGTGNTATLILTGSYSGVTSIFFDPAGAACQTTSAKEAGVSGIIAGTISGATATFTGIIFSATAGQVCEYAGGTSLIGVNPSGLSATVTVPASTGIAATTVTSPTPIGPSVYSQGTPYFVTYVPGNQTTYPTFLRIVNNSAAPIQVYADVQTDAGSVGGATVETSLAPFTNALVADTAIVSMAGVTLTPGTRANMIVFAAPTNGAVENAGNAVFGAGAVGISHLMVNPGGVVVQMGGNNSP